MAERSLVLIKPHIFIDNNRPGRATEIVGYILLRYSHSELNIQKVKSFTFTDEMVAEFYCDKLNEPYYENIRAAMTMGPCMAIVLAGKNAIAIVRAVNGATNPLKATPGTIRRDYGRPESGPNNAVHGSDSVANAEREIKLIFGPEA